MNTIKHPPAQVTEAHRELVSRIDELLANGNMATSAQAIADSEARAVVTDSQGARRQLLIIKHERDQLRAEVERITEDNTQLHASFVHHQARAERAEAELADARASKLRWENEARKRLAELATERARLEEMAAELAHCAGYIASVRTDRQITWHEELYALQTVEWAEGAVEIAEKANAVLEAHDAAMKEGA